VEVSFTGLGVALIHTEKDRPDSVKGVELLLVDTRPHCRNPLMCHLPRLTFAHRDLKQTSEPSFDHPHVTAEGLPLVEFHLEELDLSLAAASTDSGFKIQRTFRSGAVEPGFLASKTASDWIPDLEQQLGISDFALPVRIPDGRYAARLKLPAGDIESRSLFLKKGGDYQLFAFGGEEPRALCESILWRRTGVTDLRVDWKSGNLEFDPALRKLQGEDKTVRLAISNLPKIAEKDRFGTPKHFPMFQAVSTSGKDPNPVIPVDGTTVTGGGACPPASKEMPS
jgi:hypothetical protein